MLLPNRQDFLFRTRAYDAKVVYLQVDDSPLQAVIKPVFRIRFSCILVLARPQQCIAQWRKLYYHIRMPSHLRWESLFDPVTQSDSCAPM